MEICIDTDIFVNALRDKKSISAKLIELIKKGKFVGYTSTITAAELYVGAYITTTLDEIDSLLSLFKLVEISHQIAKLAGEIRAKTTITLDDALVASCAKRNNLTLITYNKKHFQVVEGLTLKTPEDLLNLK